MKIFFKCVTLALTTTLLSLCVSASGEMAIPVRIMEVSPVQKNEFESALKTQNKKKLTSSDHLVNIAFNGGAIVVDNTTKKNKKIANYTVKTIKGQIFHVYSYNSSLEVATCAYLEFGEPNKPDSVILLPGYSGEAMLKMCNEIAN